METIYIDIGSTDIKFCNSQDKKKIHTVPFPMSLTRFPYFEADAEEIICAVRAIINQFPTAEKILFSVQMHGYILRMKSGTVLPYVSWRDRRAETFAKGDIEVKLPFQCGTSCKPNLPAVSIRYRIGSGEFALTDIDEFFTLGSYLIYRLTGKNATHITDAAATGFYDGVGNASVTPFRLPQVMKFSAVGKYEGKSVYTPIGDHQASIVSLDSSVLRRCVILNMGTAAQICSVGDRYINFNKCLCESRPFFEGRRLYTVTGLFGGEWIRCNYQDKRGQVEAAIQYRKAISVLPTKNELAVIAGRVSEYFGGFLENVLNRLDMPWFYAHSSALDGLAKLAEVKRT